MKTPNKKAWPVAIKTIVLAMAGAGMVSLPYMAYANPTGGQVVAGNVTIRQESATKIGITQTTAKGIIDWQKYSIGANEQVQYYQPSASSVTLNRVVGQDPSKILGRLTANGQIFLVNPNGIYFGKNAQVDVAGLVASTHNIRNEDFLAGKYNFNIPGKPGASVINEGTIRIADTGIASFVAPSVANRGVIVARLGKVTMAAANGFTLDFHGDQLLSFLVTDEVAKTAFDIDGKQLTSFVENSGRIEAQGGYVLLTAKAAESAIHGVINHSGVIEATTVGLSKGEIILNAGKGSLEVSGTLDASAPNGGDGGFIETSGAQLSISPEIKITTLAATGKHGSWLIDPFNILIGTGGISPNALNTATSNIILEATNDITFQSPVSVTQAGVGLTAKAGRNIQVDANISTNNGEINLLAGFDSFTNAAGVNDGKVIINGARVNSGTAARNIIGRGPSTDGLVGYWTFNGNAKDGSGNANNGSSLGNVTFTSDGTRDIVKFGGYYSPGSVVVANNSSLHFSSNMTLSYWVRIDSTVGMNGYGQPATNGSVGTTVAKSHDRSGFFSLMGTGGNGEYYSTFGNDVYRGSNVGVSSVTGASTASTIGQWVHVAYTFSANEAKIYINGALKNSVSRPINFSIANTQNLYFGKYSDSWYPLNGALDEVRLYNQTLNSNRISEIYSGATPPVTPPVTPIVTPPVVPAPTPTITSNPITSGSLILAPKKEVFIASAHYDVPRSSAIVKPGGDPVSATVAQRTPIYSDVDYSNMSDEQLSELLTMTRASPDWQPLSNASKKSYNTRIDLFRDAQIKSMEDNNSFIKSFTFSKKDSALLVLSITQGILSTSTGLVPTAGLSSSTGRKALAYLKIFGENDKLMRLLDFSSSVVDLETSDIIRNLMFGTIQFSALPFKDFQKVAEGLYKLADSGYKEGVVSDDFLLKTSSIVSDIIGEFQPPGVLKVALKGYAATIDTLDVGAKAAENIQKIYDQKVKIDYDKYDSYIAKTRKMMTIDELKLNNFY